MPKIDSLGKRLGKTALSAFLWVGLLMGISIYGIWYVSSYERGFRASAPLRTVIGYAFYLHQKAKAGPDGRHPYIDGLTLFVNENGVEVGAEVKSLALQLAPQAAGCTFWWWPWHSCLGVRTTSRLYDNNVLRDVIHAAILHPCHFLSVDRSWSVPTLEAARATFGCRSGDPIDGNPFDVNLIVAGDNGGTIRFEATR